MSLRPARPQSVGGVLDTTFQLYKASVVKMIPLSLLTVIAGSPQLIYTFRGGDIASTGDLFAMLELMTSGGYVLATLVGTIASLWMLSAAYLKVAAIGSGGDLGLGAALQKALTRLPAVLIMMLLLVIALLVGFFLLLVPCLILAVSLVLCFNTALFENKGPVDALIESHRLVWGNWWRTAAILTVGFVIIFVIYLIVGLLVAAITPLFVPGASDPEGLVRFAAIGGVLVVVLMSLLTTPFYVSLAIAIYWELRLRKDGGDLAARVGAIDRV